MPQFNYLNQANQQAQSAYDQFSSPTQLMSQFQRLGMSRTPTLHDYLGMMSARQGTGIQAREAFEGAQRQSQDQSFEAFQRFLLGSQENALDAMGQMQQNYRQAEGMKFQDTMDRRNARRSLINTLLGGGMGALGMFLGGGMFGGGGNTPTGTRTPGYSGSYG